MPEDSKGEETKREMIGTREDRTQIREEERERVCVRNRECVREGTGEKENTHRDR